MNNSWEPMPTTGVTAVDELCNLELQMLHTVSEEDKRARFIEGLIHTDVFTIINKDFILHVNWLLAEEKTIQAELFHALGKGLIIGRLDDVSYISIPFEPLEVVALRFLDAKFIEDNNKTDHRLLEDMAFYVPVNSVRSATCFVL
ncbi:hypothetical protein H7171_04650 [Candidatus Saccharibacteria bacterium]|nr:hypothetical protein [Candidatus Saccharibacteria bacterium]